MCECADVWFIVRSLQPCKFVYHILYENVIFPQKKGNFIFIMSLGDMAEREGWLAQCANEKSMRVSLLHMHSPPSTTPPYFVHYYFLRGLCTSYCLLLCTVPSFIQIFYFNKTRSSYVVVTLTIMRLQFNPMHECRVKRSVVN